MAGKPGKAHRFPGSGRHPLDLPKPGCHPSSVGITRQQFEQMRHRIAGTRRTRTPVPLTEGSPAATPAAIILGVDPSLRGTGYGVIRRDRPHPVALTHGTIRCPAGWELSRCLLHVTESLRQVIRQHHPTVCAIEGLFYAQNLRTALIMGQARGAAIVAAAEAGLDIFEIAPRKVKQAIVGYGAAQKLAVAKMVQRLLHLPQAPEPDAADALALALTHAQEAGRYTLTPPKRV